MLSVIITTDINRNAREALALNAAKWRHSAHEIVVVAFGLSADAQFDLRRLATTLVTVEGRNFNKSLGINIGVAASSMDNIFLLDADVIVGTRTLTAGLNALDSNRFVTIRKVRERDRSPLLSSSCENWIELCFPTTKVAVRTNKTFADGARSGPGLIFLRRNWFLELGGMNSALTGWGWEDVDLICRLQAKLGLKRKELGSALHLSHHSSSAVLAEQNRLSEITNMQLCLDNYARLDFAGTYFSDNPQEVENELSGPITSTV